MLSVLIINKLCVVLTGDKACRQEKKLRNVHVPLFVSSVWSVGPAVWNALWVTVLVIVFFFGMYCTA